MEHLEEITEPLHSIIRTLSGSEFAATVGDFYRGESAVLNAIKILQGEHEEVFPSMISTFLRITRPTVTQALRTLERKKLIERTIYNNDRRKIAISLTQAGESEVEIKQNEVDAWCSSMASRLGKENLISLLNAIQRALTHMEIRRKR